MPRSPNTHSVQTFWASFTITILVCGDFSIHRYRINKFRKGNILLTQSPHTMRCQRYIHPIIYLPSAPCTSSSIAPPFPCPLSQHKLPACHPCWGRYILPLRVMIEFLRPQSNPRHKPPSLIKRLEFQSPGEGCLFTVGSPFW